KVSPKVQTRFVLSTPQGVFLTAQPMDFTRRYNYMGGASYTRDGQDTSKFLLWRRIYSRGNASGGTDFPVKLFNESVRTVAISADGGSVFLALDIYDGGSGTSDSISYENYLETKLVRVDGINDTSLYYISDNLAGNIRDTNRFQSSVIGTYNRRISTIATDPNNVNRLVVAFEGYQTGDNIIYSTNAMGDAPTFTTLANPPQSSDRAPIYTALIEKFEGNDLYVGTEEGIYKMQNFTSAASQWEKDGNVNVPVYHIWQQTQNLPQISFTEVSAGVSEDVTYSATENAGVMYAATYGRGVLVNTRYQQENPAPQSYVGLSDINNPAFVATLNVYPNPASNKATISYSIDNPSTVLFRMYDINGRLISSLDNGRQAKGVHTQLLDVSNMNKGVYVIQMITGDASKVAKLIVE
ncbi:MAG: T9SS type A sorting domain-containing protein, partial [Bacteroidota bacterium]|nr:T9SS type A sorting domain-containing protein [Bacteroidota bacterium]